MVESRNALFQLSGVGVVETDLRTGRFVRANTAFCDMVGYSEAELQRLTHLDLAHPDDRECDAVRFAALQRGEVSQSKLLTRVVHKGGEVVWLELHAMLLSEGDKAVNLSVVNDVTKWKRSEESLGKSEAHLAAIFAGAEVGLSEISLDGRFLRVNNTLCRLLGRSRDDLLTLNFADVTYREDMPTSLTMVQRLIERGESVSFDKRYQRPDGSTIWANSTLSLLSTHHNPLPVILAVTADITERKRAEEALQGLNETLERRVEERTEALSASEQRFSQAFYVNPIPACMTTLESNTFVEVNDAFLELTRYSRDEVLGKTSSELTMWSVSGDQEKMRKAQREGGGFRNLELRLRTKDGAVKTILMSAEMIQLDGEQGLLKMFYDITARKQIEEQLHRAIQEVMTDTTWLSRRILDQLSRLKSGNEVELEEVRLSRREQQVLERLALGLSNDAIAQELDLVSPTVRNYISAIYNKLGVHSRAEAVVWARERGIVG